MGGSIGKKRNAPRLASEGLHHRPNSGSGHQVRKRGVSHFPTSANKLKKCFAVLERGGAT